MTDSFLAQRPLEGTGERPRKTRGVHETNGVPKTTIYTFLYTDKADVHKKV